jgi:molecular chaperone Hsp33
MDDEDIITSFSLCNNHITGRIVKLSKELNIILKQDIYTPAVSQILAEMLLVAALIGSKFKSDILLSIQLNAANGSYIIADYNSQGYYIRACAEISELSHNEETYQSIIKDAIITVTIDQQGESKHRYQGVVEVNGLSLTQAVENYFNQSEQIESLIKIAVGKNIGANGEENWSAGAIMLQKLPYEEQEEIWQDILPYFTTIRDYELFDTKLKTHDLLYLLYHEIGVKVFSDIILQHHCRCTEEGIIKILQSFSQKDLEELTKEDGKIHVQCKFCNTTRIFDKAI